MAKYKEGELFAYLLEIGCIFDGDVTTTSGIWVTADGHVFSIPLAEGGWLDADVIDLILSDRWLPRKGGKPPRY